MQLIVDKLLTQYELSGEGKLILLLHGWSQTAKNLGQLQKELAASHQVLAVDLPGFGATQTPDAAWDLDDYAEFLKDLLQKLNLPQPYAVIGHSNGGALAVRAVSLGELRPDKLVLLAASGVRTNSHAKRLIFKFIAKAGNAATIWLPEHRRAALRKRLYGAAGSDMLTAPHLQDTFKKTVRQDVQGDAAAIKTPTLLIYAADDQDVPVADGKQYNKLIKNSRLEVIEQAGHFVHTDQPEKVTQLVEEFLA
ncbi:MAG TPA: alpha/beta hydrolase [Candidatus Saccharimonadales bacterium]|nr:alpha/beta hydrolase [Candidatus Saccharimonadales bacterium]